MNYRQKSANIRSDYLAKARYRSAMSNGQTKMDSRQQAAIARRKMQKLGKIAVVLLCVAVIVAVGAMMSVGA